MAKPRQDSNVPVGSLPLNVAPTKLKLCGLLKRLAGRFIVTSAPTVLSSSPIQLLIAELV